MPEIYLVRHAQASFGAADYDQLSELGDRQSEALGRALVRQGVKPSVFVVGAQKRHLQTMQGILRGMKLEDRQLEQHAGLNEFDFKSLLGARFNGKPAPEGMHSDRRTHFRILRETVLEWAQDRIESPPERWSDFVGRVKDARDFLASFDKGPVLAVSSGGAIGQMVRLCLNAPAEEQIRLQLQIRNCGVTRFFAAPDDIFLTGFNETPHIDADNQAELLTYS
ncbi:histidine phosphatase family protein [Rhizobium sp. L1K21]|uniref:histidine phosphatase family protein n=1 Tax=Rhizobium sp. L1K21 TaxID=2954933 RepID=UPI002093D41A|nr:histidine phosphatase family protein [Rhizobium sp. L1K21]MCO6188619.1 phosphoglycerate mutase family protein [Rhizobium sp. L1K21]